VLAPPPSPSPPLPFFSLRTLAKYWWIWGSVVWKLRFPMYTTLVPRSALILVVCWGGMVGESVVVRDTHTTVHTSTHA
jgi:hypothetical protein